MEKIKSFQIDHKKLNPGLYLSRIDYVKGNPVSTFDLRFKKPNVEPVFNIAPMHTVEHIGATFLRNHARKDEVIYFGPMGCRTGFYLILSGELSSKDALPFVTEMVEFVSKYEGDIPGATEVECGNYLDQNLPVARYECKAYLNVLKNATDSNLVYPS